MSSMQHLMINHTDVTISASDTTTKTIDAKKTVLYIEDNADNALIVNGILSHEGYDVHIADDGLAGIALAEEAKPDLIITDFHLPNMNGPEVVTTLRNNELFQDTPIMMLTADIYNKSASQAAGIDSYLNKPIRYNQLVKAVQELLDEPQKN